MSASTERKNRQAARAAGTDKKLLAAQEQARKTSQSKLRWTLGTIAIVLLIALIFFLDSGYLYTHTTALTIGDKSYSPAEVNYYYANEYHNFVNQYGSYASLFGLDTSTGLAGLDEQPCSMIEDGTWRDYFLQAAERDMAQIQAYAAYAADNGIALDEEEIAEVDADLDAVAAQARTLGYSSADNLYAANYGNGVNSALVRQATLDSALASKVYTTMYDSLEYSDEELEEYYQGLAGASDYFDFSLYSVDAALEEGADAPSETALTEAHAEAEAILTAYLDGADVADVTERFEVAVDSQAEGAVPTSRSRVSGSSVDTLYSEWLLDSARKNGDAAVFDGETGSVVVLWLSRDDNHYTTRNVRHILVKAVAGEDGSYTDEALETALASAQEILAEYEAGDQTEESFATMANLYSEDEGSNTNGGLYENIYKGQMVAEFEDFCFADHKAGDTGIVYGQSSSYAGYHVMYYVGEGPLYSNLIAQNAKRGEDLDSWNEGVMEGFEAVESGAIRRVG